jgi:hypothetical protein
MQKRLKRGRLQVVFLTHKAAMFDSLESIWLAARDDPQCEPYVIPVPYYDVLPDGGRGSEHFEGALFPPHVPVTDYKNYDMGRRRPDIIFINNPYDDLSYAARVHPDYYSTRLIRFTDFLAYVPYFVCTNVSWMPPIVTNGVILANKTFVESEEVRRYYIDDIKKEEVKQQCEGKFGSFENRIVALGSPKYDKAVNAKPGDFVIPDGWKRPLAGKKRVALYNTTVKTITVAKDDLVADIRGVLEWFRDMDDVALWWRPHPYSAETYRSMRPQWAEDYRRLVEDYKQAGYGVYDDTPDLYRAIAMSDVYFGDGGSVPQLYSLTGKEVVFFMRGRYSRFSGGKPVGISKETALGIICGEIKNADTAPPAGMVNLGRAGASIYKYCKKRVI